MAPIVTYVWECSLITTQSVCGDELLIVLRLLRDFAHLMQLLEDFLGGINGHNLVSLDGHPRHVGHFADAISGTFEVPKTVLEVLNDFLQNCAVVQRLCIHRGGARAARTWRQLLFCLQPRVSVGRPPRVCCLAFLADLNSEKVSADGARLRVGSGGRRYGVDRSQEPCCGHEEYEGR